MKLISKDNIIMFLLVAVTMFMTLFYRERQVSLLLDKVAKTESLLKSVKWNEQSRNYLLTLGYNIPIPVKKEVVEDKEEKK
ncbi:hypothetical protein LCGC14_0394960 [marine sediment metagenome]|uniref:Cell division protein FtsL n=1 Tax=marine sediment metagenome TaxID=412755 RepID=A0A0F9VKA5_9ZZZZ